MSRLSAILILCLAFSIPAIAIDEAGAPAESRVSHMESATAPASPPPIPDLEDLPPEVLEKLDPEQIADLLASREETKVVEAVFDSTTIDLAGVLVPLGFFLTILLGLTATLVFRYRKHGQLQQTLRLMIEKGAEIPPELVTPPVPPYRDLRRGVILVGVGLAVVIFFGFEEGFTGGEWALGLIPGFIGAGYLLIWRISRRAESG